MKIEQETIVLETKHGEFRIIDTSDGLLIVGLDGELSIEQNIMNIIKVIQKHE